MSESKFQIEERYRKLVNQLMAEGKELQWHEAKPGNTQTGRQILSSSREEQSKFALAILEQLSRAAFDSSSLILGDTLQILLRRKLQFEHDEVIGLLNWSLERKGYDIQKVIKVVEDYLDERPLTMELQNKIKQLIKLIDSYHSQKEMRQIAAKLRGLCGLADQSSPLVNTEPWANAAISDLRAMDSGRQAEWNDFLNACKKAVGSAPAARWLKEVRPLFEKIEFSEFKQAVLKWFPLVDESMPSLVNEGVLRALVWLCSSVEDRDIARALNSLTVSAFRKVPGVGPKCIWLGNACVWALGNMPGTAGVEQLALLKAKIKLASAQNSIEKALAAAAKGAGLSPGEIQEMSVPTYGFQEVGVRREQIGEFTAELKITGTTTTETLWIKPDGKKQASVPQTVKTQHAERQKELAQTAKDIQKMLPAQRDRIESLYLEQRKWPLPVWRERYLDHPLIGALARRIIWKFSDGEKTASGIWRDGPIVDTDKRALDWLNEKTQVELWHPIHESADAVIAWRDWLTWYEVTQPFKQAHREIYLLTDAERATHTYSNRFAAHIIKQHQFNALCAARGWKNKLRLMVDDSCPPATRMLPAWGLRAEFWIDSIGDNFGVDTNETGTFLYLATDQVRFYPIDARQHYSHASGGGYHLSAWGEETVTDPTPLEQIPPLVFSEVMRDVDLFVGVASVGADPNWADGGADGRYRDYWLSYSFGELSETAKTRRQILERLIPRLKIADRCRLTDKFLIVRGDIRSYKIHLGSGNILMEPNDQYLCIVPARGSAGASVDGKVFLPFEGDNTLAIILSKAFLLAADKEIKDPTIVRQIAH